MRQLFPVISCLLFFRTNCSAPGELTGKPASPPAFKIVSVKHSDPKSWAYFLEHLPVKTERIFNYNGSAVTRQGKQCGVVQFDVGGSDLQQCADALLRLRAEFLFSQKRFSSIGFHFVNGYYYSWEAYCSGLRLCATGSKLRFSKVAACGHTHQTLRKYLDIVYAYAGTLSLAAELKKTDKLATGTVIIQPGSPGHCLIIADEASDAQGRPLYKLVESYTPAQSIYVLRNIYEPALGAWYHLDKGTIKTSSYIFRNYQLGVFE